MLMVQPGHFTGKVTVEVEDVTELHHQVDHLLLLQTQKSIVQARILCGKQSNQVLGQLHHVSLQTLFTQIHMDALPFPIHKSCAWRALAPHRESLRMHAAHPYDWNQSYESLLGCRPTIQFQDETLRDGLQCPSVVDPPIEGKLEILHWMNRLGIHGADVGLPGAGPRAVADVTRIVEEIRDHRLAIKPSCAGRTLAVDIDPIARISDQTGVLLEADLFLGSSPVRQYAEGWTLDTQLRIVDEAVTHAVKRGLEVMFVTEDTIRSHPDTLRRLYTTAIHCGAIRICLCDTVGHATPDGVRALVSFLRQVVKDSGAQVALDWHGHRDRGLDVANTLAAVEAGVDRIHGTALGIGERVGNTPMEHLLVNLKLAGVIGNDLTHLTEYIDAVRRHCQVPLPENWPGLGRDTFRVVSSQRQRAIQDALERGKLELAEDLFSSVRPSLVGRCLQVSKESRT